MYGFSKVEGGPSHGSYVHPDFCKNDQAKALTIQRQSSTRSRRQYYHLDSAKSSSRTISSPSLTTTAGKGKLPSFEESPTKSDSSNNVIIGRDSSPLPSTLSNTFSWDHAALPVSHSCDWQSEHQQTMFQEDHLSTPDDESLFEPRPIELMLMSSCQSISLNTPSW